MTPAGPLVSPDQLRQQLGTVTIVDCRFEMADPPRARAAYLEAHIPGAAFLDVEGDLSDMSRAPAEGRHPLPDRDRFQAAARRAGISGDRLVVAYDQAMTGGAARLWWLLRHFGHEQAFVLDGGLAAWPGELRAGPEDVPAGDFSAGPGVRWILTAEDVQRELAAGRLTLLDARAADRYRGEDTTGLDPAVGHVPGAISLPFPAAMEGVPAAITSAGDVAVYCGSGVTACVALLALERDGRPDAGLYAGSWSEWSRRGLPVATGG